MGRNLKESANEWIEEGYSREDIEDYLFEQGYSEDEVCSLLRDLEKDRDNVWSLQKYSWLLLFSVLFSIYLFSSAANPSFMLESLGSRGINVVFGFLSAIVFLHLILGIYQVSRDNKRRGWLSISSFSAGISVYLIGIIFIYRNYFQNYVPVSINGLLITSLFINILILMSAFFAALFFRKQLGRFSYVFIFIFLFLSLFTLGVHYRTVQDTYSQLDFPDISDPSLSKIVNQRKHTTDEMILKAALVPPPLSKTALGIIFTSTTGGDYVFFKNLLEEAEARGIKEVDLTSPGTVCGGTRKNLKEKIEGLSYERAILNVNKYLNELIENNRKVIIEVLKERCDENTECELTKTDIGLDLNVFVEGRKEKLELLKEVFKIEEVDISEIKVENCSSITEKFYGIRLKDIECKDKFNMFLENAGNREINLQGTKIIISKLNGRELNRYTYEKSTKLDKGEKMISLSADELKKGSKESIFDEDEIYMVTISIENGNLIFSALCKGGNSFYQTDS